ncbi:MAG: DnaD domain protein [Chloroflexia bacterium]|nr:DnaD domain protein [Chloroflexia bacterium]
MSQPFHGFSTQRDSAIALPPECFEQLLAEIQDLAEFKVLLTVFRLVAAQRDRPREEPRLVSWAQLRGDGVLERGLTVLGGELTPEERLDRALERAVARGTLLHLNVQRRGHSESWYLLHTAQNRRLVQEWEQDPGRLAGTSLDEAAAVRAQRPNIYVLYEQNIGLLSPLLAEELEEAAGRYPPDWIEDAFREAVAYNRRSWRYIRAILENWERQGRGDRPGKREGIDFEKYTSGEYADLFGQD